LQNARKKGINFSSETKRIRWSYRFSPGGLNNRYFSSARVIDPVFVLQPF